MDHIPSSLLANAKKVISMLRADADMLESLVQMAEDETAKAQSDDLEDTLGLLEDELKDIADASYEP